MTLHKHDAIVLKRDRSGDSSLLVDLFLRDGGKVKMLAKGARNPGSVMVGKLEPFDEVEVVFYRKNDESLSIISQINQKHSNPDLTADIRRLSYASAVVEALNNMVYADEKHEKIYQLVSGTFYMLNYAQPRKLEFYFLVFLIKAMDLIGISPQFDKSARSGNPIEDEEILFSVPDGGVIGKAEADPQGAYFRLDRGIVKAIQKCREADIDKLKGLNFSDKQKDIIKDLLLSFLNYHTDGKPSFNSLNFLSKLASF